MKQGLSITRGALDGVEAFLRVAERRSFSAAAIDLGISASAVSQTIRALEERVGVPLLMRTTRSVGLTQAGEMFLDRARPAFDGLGDAFEAARTLSERPAGRLRINLPRAVVQHLFQPILAGFCAAYPEIELEICAEDGFVDVTEGGYDAGVRLGESLAADMVAVRLSDPFGFTVVATPDYLDRHGRPQKPADLRDHKCIRVRLATGNFMDWGFIDGNRQINVDVSGPVIVNDFAALVMAVETGVGIAYMAEPNVKKQIETGKLEVVLQGYGASSGGLFLYYPSRRQVMPKLRAFIDYVRANLDPATMARR
jgi:DNA-binding transcriptional LysR family regulator